MKKDINKRGIIINIYSSAGAGKSTKASDLFSFYKKKGYEVELVPEYAKDLVWSGNLGAFSHQISITAEQFRRTIQLVDKVDYIICESPFPLGQFYAEYNGLNQNYLIAVKDLCYSLEYVYDKTINFFLEYNFDDFNPNGRLNSKLFNVNIYNDIKEFIEQREHTKIIRGTPVEEMDKTIQQIKQKYNW